jgi:predicted dehydrogenase
MATKRIKIGFIGLNPDSHWASKAHLPALKSLSEDFEIVGVANSTYESAKKTALALQIPHAFENARALVQSPEIELVVITVKVAFHFDLVKAALKASGKCY